MTLTLSMTPGVAALRAEAVAYPHTIAPHGDFCAPTIQTKNMPSVWGTDHVNVSACYIPFRFRRTEHGRSAAPKLNRRHIAQRTGQPQTYPYAER